MGNGIENAFRLGNGSFMIFDLGRDFVALTEYIRLTLCTTGYLSATVAHL